MFPSVEKLYNYSWLLTIGTLPDSCSCLAATNTLPGAHSKYSGTCWNCSCQIQKHVFKWNLITHILPLWIYCISGVQRTLLYASRVKARLASVGSRNSIMAVSPEGGSSTRPKEPWAENSSSNSADATPAGRFFTRITVVLLGAAACKHPVHEETAENNWEIFFFF